MPTRPRPPWWPPGARTLVFVVAVDGGLLVPVLHGIDRLSVAEIAQRRSELVGRALQGKLRRDELEGATFSVSNLGPNVPIASRR